MKHALVVIVALDQVVLQQEARCGEGAHGAEGKFSENMLTRALLLRAAALLPAPAVAAAAPVVAPPLLVVGAGVLGRLAASEWRLEHATAASPCQVIGVTRSANAERAADMRAQGIDARTREDVEASDERWPYVLFCASPGGNEDYPAEVARALRLWDPSLGGRFVFTSSAGVYAEDAGGVVVETSPVADTPRAAKLLSAEREVLAAGGTVLRLAGLYLIDRGAHNFWLSKEEVAQRADGLINQVHYRDAAYAAVCALARGGGGEVLLAADDTPLTRQEICVEACRAPQFRGRAPPRFTGTDGGVGKVVDCSLTRSAVGWKPRYATFGKFIDSLVAAECDAAEEA